MALANICFDVQINICLFLHPSDILALRQTCKALQPSTRQRVVWVAALHRVCIDNTLFLPSFPISDMSDLELEKAAMAPRRWIELCGAYEKQHLDDPGAVLCPRATRFINDSLPIEVNYSITSFFIVPGGRYLVVSSYDGGIYVLDLGYSSSADYKLIASVGLEGGCNSCIVQATQDGMGLTIFSSKERKNCSVYEIYPQSETPHLTQIANLDFDPSQRYLAAFLLPGTVIWYTFYGNRIVFRVWDYRLNHSISFSVSVNHFNCEVILTKTAVIVICDAILICAIPPLSPQPPDFFDHNPTHMPPLFTIPFPDGIVLGPELLQWKTISSWYFGSSHPLYFDMLCRGFKLHRFQIILKPDLSTASLCVINTSTLAPHDFNCLYNKEYRICEDTIVCCGIQYDFCRQGDQYQLACGAYTGLTLVRFVISYDVPAHEKLLPYPRDPRILSSCPATGRYIVVDTSNSVVVLDLL